MLFLPKAQGAVGESNAIDLHQLDLPADGQGFRMFFKVIRFCGIVMRTILSQAPALELNPFGKQRAEFVGQYGACKFRLTRHPIKMTGAWRRLEDQEHFLRVKQVIAIETIGHSAVIQTTDRCAGLPLDEIVDLFVHAIRMIFTGPSRTNCPVMFRQDARAI